MRLVFYSEQVLAERVVEIGGDSSSFALLIFEQLPREGETGRLLLLKSPAEQMNPEKRRREENHEQDNQRCSFLPVPPWRPSNDDHVSGSAEQQSRCANRRTFPCRMAG